MEARRTNDPDKVYARFRETLASPLEMHYLVGWLIQEAPADVDRALNSLERYRAGEAA